MTPESVSPQPDGKERAALVERLRGYVVDKTDTNLGVRAFVAVMPGQEAIDAADTIQALEADLNNAHDWFDAEIVPREGLSLRGRLEAYDSLSSEAYSSVCDQQRKAEEKWRYSPHTHPRSPRRREAVSTCSVCNHTSDEHVYSDEHSKIPRMAARIQALEADLATRTEELQQARFYAALEHWRGDKARETMGAISRNYWGLVEDHKQVEAQLREAAQKAHGLLVGLADNDCGCNWIPDDVGEGGLYDHNDNCLLVAADDLRAALSTSETPTTQGDQ